ncbi:hypothetical protein [Streptomyces parvus]|uniref:hypothetical protein n=1 Tax=Streptomyces parvus TaxID=66428 RepID=UPI003317885A
MTTPPPMPAQPPTTGTTNFTLDPAPATPPATAPAPPAGGGVLAPVTLARPTRDASGGSAAHTSQGDNDGASSKPGKGEKNTAGPGMWKGIAALIANRPQRKMTVQHTISELRGSSTDRKINHGVTEKRGATSDSKSNRTATTAHASKSDKSAKTANTRDAKTSAASTKADKNSRDAKTADTRSAAKKDNRDAKTADTRSSADKTSRDAKKSDTRASADKHSRDTKAASDRKNHSTRQQADKTAADKQNRTARDDKTLRKTDASGRQPSGGKATNAPEPKVAPKTLGPGAAPSEKSAKGGDKLVKPDPATQSKPQPATTPPTPADAQDKAKPRKGPYTAQPAREAGFNAGAQHAATEADKSAWRDGYEDGQQAIRDKAARDKAQLDAARDRARGVQPAKPTAPPKPSSPPATSDAPDHQQAARPAPTQGTPPMPTTPASTKPSNPAPAVEVRPLGAVMSPVQPGVVHLSSNRVMTTGEVRTLRKLTLFLNEKERETSQVADECKQAKEVSAGRIGEIQKLVEACQDPKIKGGKQLTAALHKLLEATTLQAKEAEKLHGNAARGTDALRTLNHNAQIRHGGVYKAVADSAETAPAERPFYTR